MIKLCTVYKVSLKSLNCYLKIKLSSKPVRKIINLYALLLHGITEPDGNRAILCTVKIICNTERCSDFVLAAVTFSDISSVIIFTVIQSRKLLVKAKGLYDWLGALFLFQFVFLQKLFFREDGHAQFLRLLQF